MTRYDDDLYPDYRQIRTDLEKYFYDIPVECPYGKPYKAVYRQAYFGPMPDELIGIFIESGYRRNGNFLYTMACPECQECVPVRINPLEFTPNRNQKRALKANSDLSVEVAPLSCHEEKLGLCSSFLKHRFPGKENSAEEYYAGFFLNNITDTFEIQYRTDEGLIGVAIVDIGEKWLNAVYFFFDPDEKKRRPGVFNILYMIEFCKQKGIDYLYLGYRIRGVSAMDYKSAFKPHSLLEDGKWVRQGEEMQRL